MPPKKDKPIKPKQKKINFDLDPNTHGPIEPVVETTLDDFSEPDLVNTNIQDNFINNINKLYAVNVKDCAHYVVTSELEPEFDETNNIIDLKVKYIDKPYITIEIYSQHQNCVALKNAIEETMFYGIFDRLNNIITTNLNTPDLILTYSYCFKNNKATPLLNYDFKNHMQSSKMQLSNAKWFITPKLWDGKELSSFFSTLVKIFNTTIGKCSIVEAPDVNDTSLDYSDKYEQIRRFR